MDSSVASSGTSKPDEDLVKPLWRYITRIDNYNEAGGNLSWKCNFCGKDFKSSYTRVRAHLLKISGKGIRKCLKVQTKDLLEMERLEEEANDRLKSNAPKNVPLPSSSISIGDNSKKRRSGSGSRGALDKAFNAGEREHLHHLIARMFYSAGLPFNLARNPYFQEAFTYASNHHIAGYLPPGYNLLRTTLLQKEKANVDRLCAPIRAMWNDKGVSIVSDGWSDSQRRPLINFMAVSDGDPMFLKSIDCSGETKDMHFIYKLLKDMFRFCDTDKPCLHLVYDMWDVMIEKVKKVIYNHEVKRLDEKSTFYDVVYVILVDRWSKNSTPLHCLAHALNPKYYSEQWLNEDPNRVPPHKDKEINQERQKCIRRYYPNLEDRNKVNLKYADFVSMSGDFRDFDSIQNRHGMDPKAWWLLHGACAPMLQNIALKLLAQPSSSSCAERNWSTCSFVHSVRRNKMTPKRAEDLVYVHSNLRLLSRKSTQYAHGETKMWDISGDAFGTFEDVGILEVASLSLDEPDMESIVFLDGGDNSNGGDEDNDGASMET